LKHAITPLAFAAIGIMLCLLWTRPPQTIPTESTLPTVEHLQPLASLVSLRADISDVQIATLDGYTGGISVMLAIRGDVLLSIDLEKARFEHLDRQNKTAVLVLPSPEALSPRLDHTLTKAFTISTYGLWQIVPSDRGRAEAMGRALRQAQQALAKQALEPKLIDKAKHHAEGLIKSFMVQTLGWTITIRWLVTEDQPS